MPILTKKQIEEKISRGEIVFEPALDAFQTQPASVDLRIGWSFYIPYTWKYCEKGRIAVVADHMDYSTTHENFQLIKLKPGQYFEILPGEMVIASTLEKINLNAGNLSGVIHPRSSASRRGLAIESGVVNPNFTGYLTIPMVNQSHHVIKIYPGERLCQILFHELTAEINKEESKTHGLSEDKYQSSTPYNMDSKLDPQEEIDFLKSGNIDGLKKKL